MNPLYFFTRVSRLLSSYLFSIKKLPSLGMLCLLGFTGISHAQLYPDAESAEAAAYAEIEGLGACIWWVGPPPVGDRSRWVEGVQLKWMQACYSSTGATPGIHGTPVGNPCLFQPGVCDEIPLETNQDDDSDAVVIRKFYYRSEPCACSEEFIEGLCVPLEEVYAKEWQTNGDLWVHPYGQGSSCPPEQYPQQDSCPDGGKKDNGPNGEAGNPISCTSGIKMQTETDYRGAGPDPLTVQRHYRSDDGDPLCLRNPGTPCGWTTTQLARSRSCCGRTAAAMCSSSPATAAFPTTPTKARSPGLSAAGIMSAPTAYFIALTTAIPPPCWKSNAPAAARKP